MICILPFALDVVRRKSYELFLVTHILFSIVALVGCF